LEKFFNIKFGADPNLQILIPIIPIKSSDCLCKTKSSDLISDINNYEIVMGRSESGNCAICRNSNVQICIGCVGLDENINQNNCEIVKSCACDHLYHFHCIEKWLNRANKCCPICNTEKFI
jgi:hypothetical protein